MPSRPSPSGGLNLRATHMNIQATYLLHSQRDPNFIIIKQWIPEADQDILFEHTRKMREGRLLTNSTIELKKERDNLLLVRKKSPARRRSTSRSWIFT